MTGIRLAAVVIVLVIPPQRAPITIEVGLATSFDRAERDAGNPSSWAACLGRELDARRDLIVAHQTLPCGQRVTICVLRTGACTEATVGDRGPRHALVDLAPATVRALGPRGFNGRELALLVAHE